jgi:hypothetical protein
MLALAMTFVRVILSSNHFLEVFPMRPVNSVRRTSLIALTGLALSGCTTANNGPFKDFRMPSFDWMRTSSQAAEGAERRALIKAATANCPRIEALPELARVTQFADESNPVSSTILSETALTKLDSSCITTENTINLDIMLNFTSTLGTAGLSQAAAQSSYSHPYFVAVVDPAGKIIAKDVFSLTPVFTSGQKEVYSSERLQQTIPLSSTIPANQYRIMIGFQLSEKELAHNRSLNPRTVNPMATPPTAAPQPLTKTKPPTKTNK